MEAATAAEGFALLSDLLLAVVHFVPPAAAAAAPTGPDAMDVEVDGGGGGGRWHAAAARTAHGLLWAHAEALAPLAPLFVVASGRME